MSRSPAVLCFSNLDWTVLRYRKQHLMEKLSARMPVAYVNPPRAIKWRDLTRTRRWTHPLDNLAVFEPPVLPGVRTRPRLQQLNYRLISACLSRWRSRHNPVVLWLYSPHALPFIELTRADLVVYDVADLYATPSGAHVCEGQKREIERLARLEAELLPRADVVLAVSEPLVERLQRAAREVHLVPNAADWPRYSQVRPRPQGAGRPRLGFVGTLAPRFDVELVAGIARVRPDWDIELVGPVSTDVAALRALLNVRLVGEVPYGDVPRWIASFDVCLLPLREIDFAYFSSPIQVYDYLAAGRAVVSTPIAQFERLPALVRTARGVDAFVAAVAAALVEPADLFAARRTFARANSWDARVATIEDLLSTRLRALTAAA